MQPSLSYGPSSSPFLHLNLCLSSIASNLLPHVCHLLISVSGVGAAPGGGQPADRAGFTAGQEYPACPCRPLRGKGLR